jgi:mutator protein MutT
MLFGSTEGFLDSKISYHRRASGVKKFHSLFPKKNKARAGKLTYRTPAPYVVILSGNGRLRSTEEPSRHRSTSLPEREEPMGRKYPSRPIVGVGAFIFRGNGEEVLVVRRGVPPKLGVWSVPGGAVEIGEPLENAIRREIQEETALEIEVLECAAVLDRIYRDEFDRVQYHYILIDYLCEHVSGEALARSDIAEARWIKVQELDDLEMTEGTANYLRKASTRYREIKAGAPPFIR